MPHETIRKVSEDVDSGNALPKHQMDVNQLRQGLMMLNSEEKE